MKSKTLKEIIGLIEPVFEAVEDLLKNTSKEDLLKALEGYSDDTKALALKVWEDLHGE